MTGFRAETFRHGSELESISLSIGVPSTPAQTSPVREPLFRIK